MSDTSRMRILPNSQANQDDVHFVVKSTTEVGVPWELDDIQYWIHSDNSNVLTCYEFGDGDRKPVGVSIFEDTNSQHRNLLHIGVRRDYRGRGLGVKLFQESLHPNQDIGLRAVIPADSEHLNNWLRNRGCTARNYQRNYWPEQCGKTDAVIMEY